MRIPGSCRGKPNLAPLVYPEERGVCAPRAGRLLRWASPCEAAPHPARGWGLRADPLPPPGSSCSQTHWGNAEQSHRNALDLAQHRSGLDTAGLDGSVSGGWGAPGCP